jgi:site-specific DNA recombinase
MIADNTKKRWLRCAVYTRKSTSEGLEQEFNSLDAQREAALAYIASQRQAGWRAVGKHYDDGGYSGGNTDRPALARLLVDIRNGQVDCVVVQRVDRLSRSLLDFARLMEMFDECRVSFVSVTQQINSATSMGRLMLNVLLSFAQFERELIAERTRDKMGAARRRGRWLGGMPVLGYDVDRCSGQLVVNPDEAQQVRDIFQLYLETGSLTATVGKLEQRGWVNKRWVTRAGRCRGGKPFHKGTLYYLLTNVTYRGQVCHRAQVYPGRHEPIVAEELFVGVAERLGRNRNGDGPRRQGRKRGWLKGLLHCHRCGTEMVLTTAARRKRRLRCYVCPGAGNGSPSCPDSRLPAAQLERTVVDQLDLPPDEAGSSPDEYIERVEYDLASGELTIRLKPSRARV